MKRTIGRIIAIILAIGFMFQTSLVAFANDNEPEWEDISLTQSEIDDILALNGGLQSNQSITRASGLITSYALAISASGSNLVIIAKTICVPDVTKCGFKTLTIYRRASSTQSWSTYKTYSDIYVNDPYYTLTKTVAVSRGYQYRATCTHYAKKNLLSTEKIDNTSNVIAIT